MSIEIRKAERKQAREAKREAKAIITEAISNLERIVAGEITVDGYNGTIGVIVAAGLLGCNAGCWTMDRSESCDPTETAWDIIDQCEDQGITVEKAAIDLTKSMAQKWIEELRSGIRSDNLKYHVNRASRIQQFIGNCKDLASASKGEEVGKRYVYKGDVIFVSKGIGGDLYGTFKKTKSGGGIRRIVTTKMPMVSSEQEAQENLDSFAESRNLSEARNA
jgi:hypothetical protein